MNAMRPIIDHAMTPSDTSDSFARISPSEFFYRNRQMAGFGNQVQAVYSTVRELVENSLDACEDIGTLPRIQVELNEDETGTLTIVVSDNGSGVPADQVADAFGTVFYGSKYNLRQRRGTFGLGVTMAVLYGQVTTNSPVEIHTRTSCGSGERFRILIDIENNRPIIEDRAPAVRDTTGTTVNIRLKGDLKRARDRVLEYLRLTTVGTPHAEIQASIAGQTIVFGPWCRTVPPKTVPTKPHPRAADLELLRRLISKSRSETRLRDFLVSSFQQLGNQTASRLLAFLSLDGSRRIETLSRDELIVLSKALKTFDGVLPPSSDGLSPIGEESFLNSVAAVLDCRPLGYACSSVRDWEGYPFIVEGVLAIGAGTSDLDFPLLYRFANRVPLLYDAAECVLTRVNRGLGWSRYSTGLTGNPILAVHVCSTRIPYKEAGKQSIAPVAEIESALIALYRSLGRRLKTTARGMVQSTWESKRMRELSREMRLIARFAMELTDGTEDSSDIDSLVNALFEVKEDGR
ncbi:MAG: DNA topoisomerase VI subunit B [Candidatus Thorarchaeota archaeon]|nr:DNA topoisomerase VI subunit B [Candidatus Thorarchaeota archaeon]